VSDSTLDTLVFSTDRKAYIEVLIGGELVGSGIDTDGNLVSVDVSFDIDTLPPTAALGVRSIPSWVKKRQTVEINAGYNGFWTTIFTGRVKKRRHGVAISTIDCVGRTAKLMQPMRARAGPRSPAKLFAASTTAEDAIIDILDDDGVNFIPSFDEHYLIDIPAWAFDLDASLDLQTAGDMVRYIADADLGCRTFESRAGTLHVRALLEAPAPDAFRTYGTVGEGASQDTPVTFDPNGAGIDTNDAVGDAATHDRRSQGWKPTASGAAASVSFWMKKVGSPTDSLEFDLYNDDGTGLPGTLLLGSSSKYPGQFLDTTDYNQVQMMILSGTELTLGTQYHIVVRRSGNVDAANYYLVGRVSGGGYADGAPGVYNSGPATWGALTGDYSFGTTTTTFSALRLLDIADDEDEDQVKKQMTVLGAVLSSTDIEGNVTQTQVYGESHIVSDDLVEGDYHYFSGSYQNSLIQTDAKADAKAEQLRDKYYRVLQTIEIEVPFDPRIDLGTTIGIVDPLVTGLSGNWWIRAYHHTLNATSANTQISLFGGDQSGTTGVTEPRPDFIWKIEQELIGNAVMQVITYTAVVASPSSHITDYHWTDDYAGGAMDQHGQDMLKVTRSYDPAVATVIHTTLEVTDDKGQVISITHTVDINSTTPGVYAPVISCAAGNTCMITITGGQDWIDTATPFLETATVTAITYDPLAPNDPLIYFFGTAEGNLYRTIDNNASLEAVYSDVDADPITCIIPDIVRRGWLWATTSDRVLFSMDFGATWTVHTDFNDPANWFQHGAGHVNIGPTDPRPLNRIIGSDPSVNRVWVMGGRGDVVESWFGTHYIPDGNGVGTWWSEIAQGDGVGAEPRDPADTVTDSVVSNGASGDLGLMFKRIGGGAPSNPYIYSALFHPVGTAAWDIGRGAMIGVSTNGVGAESNNLQLKKFLALLDNKTAYVTPDGDGFWPIPDVLPGTAGNRPHHLINVSAWQDIFLSATDEGIAKTIDGGATWGFFRPMGTPIDTTWPAGAIGYEVAFAYRGPAATSSFRLLISTYDIGGGTTATLMRNGTGPWTKQSEDATAWPTVDLYSFPTLTRIFRTRADHKTPDPRGVSNTIWETLQYSNDYGINWIDTTVLQCADITRAANGDLYALSGDGDQHVHKVFRSVDDGDNWTMVKDDTTLFGGEFVDYRRIVADPINQDIVIAISYQKSFMRTVAASTGGAWTITNPTFGGLGAYGAFDFERTNIELVIGQNGRYFVAYEHPAGNQILIDYNDNGGAGTWPNSLAHASFANEPPRAMFIGAMDIYFMHAAVGGLMRSRDNGATWESFTDLAVGHQTFLRGYAWDAPTNVLYCGTEIYDPATGDTDINQMQAPLVTFGSSGTWVQVGAGIAAALGHGDNKLCSEGMEAVK